MEFAQAERWLSGLVNAERPRPGERVPAKFSLAPMRALLARVGEPQRGLPVLHIAGSKGKGSTALFAEALLAECGLRVGLYTSPHLLRWTERFRVDGAEVSDAALAAALSKLRPPTDALREDAALWPSFFDVTTAAAFLLFAEARVDCAILEVGLGGRLDSTNVCEPLVTCVTSIELEHTEQLGTTHAAIAREKAGIAKPGVPLVMGALEASARRAVCARAREVGAPLVRAEDAFRVVESTSAADGSRVHYRERGEARASVGGGNDASARAEADFEARFTLAAVGAHQVGNAALALCCARQFVRARAATLCTDWERIARRAFARARLPGRVEILSRAPWRVVDSAHTKASARALAAVLAEIPRARAHLVLSVSVGKNLDALCEALAPQADAITCTRAEPSRSLPPQQIAEALARHAPKLPVQIIPDAREALRTAAQTARAQDLLCATGSIYLAGLAREVWR